MKSVKKLFSYFYYQLLSTGAIYKKFRGGFTIFYFQ
jgi:hypothetical protein